MTKLKKSEKTAPVCEGCHKWQVFKQDCYFFWEDKKVCSAFSDQEGNECLRDVRKTQHYEY
jgi:hypothetical protein